MTGSQAGPKIPRGLLLGFLLVIGLLLALAGIGIAYLNAMNNTITRIVEEDNERAHLTAEMYIAARERALQLHAILQQGDPFARDELVPEFYRLAGQFREARQRLLAMRLTPGDQALLEQQGKLTAQGSALQDEVLGLALADRREDAERLLLSQAIPLQDQVTLQLRRLLDHQVESAHNAAREAQAQYRLALGLMLGSASVAVLLAAAIAFVVITQQTRLLAMLRESEREARILLENIPVPVWFKDPEAHIAWANVPFARIAGRALADIAGKQESDLWGRVEGLKSGLEDQQAMAAGNTMARSRTLPSADGELSLVISRTPIANANGGWKGILCVANDLTEMERMTNLLVAANLELQAQKTALDEHAIVSITDTQGVITYVNDKFCTISQYPRETLVGQNHNIINSGFHPDGFFADMWRTISAGRVWHGEVCNRNRDGGLYWVDSTIVPFLDAAEVPYQYVAIRTDITARKSLEASLQDSNVELQWHVEERTQALSQALQQLEADIDERKRSQDQLKQQYLQLEALHRQLQDAQGQLLQSEKLASIGQLAAGVAHEINNPIGYVHSNLGTLENYIRDLFKIIAAYESAEVIAGADPTLCAEVAAIKKQLDLAYLKEDIPVLMGESKEGITRVRKIVQDLKDFSRLDSSPDWQTADLQQGLDSTLNIVQNEIKYRADVVKEYGDIPEIECLPSQLNQVFMNLLVNAAHAIEGPRGTITLRTGRRGDDEVWVEVADTGHGIPEDKRDRIFDPFFTTKAVGKGTGLGLSLAYGIVQKHHGRFELESEVGKGTTFRVILPIVHTPEGVAAGVAPATSHST